MNDLASRLSHRVQLITDGHHAYLVAVQEAFGHQIDWAQLAKLYGPKKGGEDGGPERFIGVKIGKVIGNPEPEAISTSYVERQNLTMRMSMQRFTRLTNGFSKKLENLGYAVALHFAYYNFARIHQSLRITPAMAAGISNHVWDLEEIAALADSDF